MSKRFILVFLTGVLVAVFNPVHSKLINLVFLACLGGAWTGLVFLAWKRKGVRIAVLLLPALVAIPFFLPGSEIEQDKLRQDYLRRMLKYEGTKYFWGGENSFGIDCSGLPRRAFRDALLGYGLRHANGRALRSYLEQWWFDASAKALGEGYRGYTKAVGVSGTIREMEYGELAPGDLAVTTNGLHVLAYAGDGKWIQADPGTAAVVTLDGRADANVWFGASVSVHRWQIFE